LGSAFGLGTPQRTRGTWAPAFGLGTPRYTRGAWAVLG